MLLIVGLVCLGSWANTFKLAKWRYELYYLDFAIGALALAVLAAFTLGTLGSELSFNDRIAVAGLRSQAFALAAGFVFNIGNMLLVAAVSLLGLAVSFPLALSLAFLIASYFEGLGRISYFGSAAVLLAIACFLAIVAARLRSAPKAGIATQTSNARRSRALKGIAVGLIGGIIIGVSSPLTTGALWGDLGLGAYAGLLMFSIGLAVSAVFLDLFLMNIAIEGTRVTFANYRSGSFKQHLYGISGGAIWAGGMLALLLAQSAPAAEVPNASTLILFTQGAILLVVLWGLFAWKELIAPKKARAAILLSILCFGGAIFLMASRHSH
jgi:glucose uptake protein